MQTMQQKLRVGVLIGGKSEEREVSFNSGRTVCDHLDSILYDIIPIFVTTANKLYILPWSFLHRGKIVDFEHRLANEAEEIHWDTLKKRIDFAYIAMHGRYVEDGSLQGLLEVLNIPYLGSGVFGSALGMDKKIHKTVLRHNGILVPKECVVEPHQPLEKQNLSSLLKKKSITLPCIVKPHKEGSSLGTSVVHSIDTLILAIEKARTASPGITQTVLIEEKIEGMEFSCIILWDYQKNKPMPLAPTEIEIPGHTQFFDYEQKYMPGKSIQHTPARTTKKNIEAIQQICTNVMNILEFKTIARIDGFLTPENNIVIIDPNSFCGAAPSSFFFKQAAYAGMNHTAVINHLIKTDLHRYNLDIVMNKNKPKKKNEKKLRIAVLFGGNSNEKEISLESGRNILYKLSPEKYDTIPLFVNKDLKLYHINDRLLVSNYTNEIEELITDTMYVEWHTLPSIADFVFNGLHGGAGENGSVQGMLEILNLPYNGSSVLASALCMNKYKTNTFLKASGFDVPNNKLISKAEWQAKHKNIIKAVEQDIGYPCIIKPHDDGCSVGVANAKNSIELVTAINTLFANSRKYAFVEERILGMELTVGVIGNENPKAFLPSQAVSQADILSIEEKFLPGAGENQTPAPLSDSAIHYVQQKVEAVYKTLGCKGYARIDCFYQSAQQSPTKKGRVIFLEPNTLPALTPATCIFHQAAEANIKPMELIDMIVQFGMQEHSQVETHFPTHQKEKQITSLGR